MLFFDRLIEQVLGAVDSIMEDHDAQIVTVTFTNQNGVSQKVSAEQMIKLMKGLDAEDYTIEGLAFEDPWASDPMVSDKRPLASIRLTFTGVKGFPAKPSL